MLDKVKDILKDTYSKGFFHLFSANTLIHLIEFGSQFFVAWILVADDIGRIKSFQSFAAIAVIIAGLGFNSSILKLCSEKKTSILEKQALFVSGIKVTLLFSAITVLIIVILSKLGLVSNDSVTNKFFIYYALSVPLVALNNLIVSYYQALKDFKKVSFLLVIARLIHVLIIISLTYLYHLKGFVAGIVIGFFLSSILLLLKTKFLSSWKNSTREHFTKNWELAKYAFLANVVNMTTVYLDVFILNHLIDDPEEFGYYGFALTLMAGLRIVTSTVQQFVTPFFSEFSWNQEQSKKAYKQASRLFIIIIAITAVGAIIVVPFIIPFLYGGKFDPSIKYFQLLTIAWVIRSIPSLKGPFLLATGNVKIIFYSVLLVFVISVGPYWYLIDQYKLDGAIYGQILSSFIFLVVISINFKRAMKKSHQLI